MRLRRCLCLVLLCAVTCCGLFSVSTYASEIPDEFFPPLPVRDGYWIITCNDSGYYSAYLTGEPFVQNASYSDNVFSSFGSRYTLTDGEWVFNKDRTDISVTKNFIVYDSSGLWASSDKRIFMNIPDPPIGTTELNPVFNAFTDQLNVPLLVGVLAGAAGVSVGLVFLWWGARKTTGALIKAFKKGKLRI